MKFNKKKVLVAALAISLIAILSMGSIAWFSDTDEVTNKFMVATSDDGEDSVFSVDVFEEVDEDGDGEFTGTGDYDAAEGAWEKGGGYTYEEILPGDTLGKRPWVRNTGSYDEYIRVKVTINNAKAWKTIFEKYELTLDDIFLGHNEAQWTRNDAETTEDTAKDTMTYVYYLNRILEPHKNGGKDAYLFRCVQIPTQLKQEDMALFTYEAIDDTTGNYVFELDILAEAVQTEHVGANAIEAFDTVRGN